MTAETQVILQRLEKVEKENRRLKQAWWVVVLIPVALSLMGQMGRSRRVEAEGFILRDASGKVRAELLPTTSGASLGLSDPSGNLRVVLATSEKGPGLVLAGTDQRPQLSLSAGGDGPSLLQYDDKGMVRLELAQRLRLFDAKDKVRVALGVSEETATIGFNYSDQSPAVVLGAQSDGPAVLLLDRQGKITWSAP